MEFSFCLEIWQSITITVTIFGSWLKKTEKKVWDNQEKLNIAWILALEELLLTLLGWLWCSDNGSEKTLLFYIWTLYGWNDVTFEICFKMIGGEGGNGGSADEVSLAMSW